MEGTDDETKAICLVDCGGAAADRRGPGGCPGAHVAPTEGGGWAKHAFYEITKDEYIAFWDLHDDSIGSKWSPALSTGMGLPIWVNHIAFRATDLPNLDARKQRWLKHGHTVHEIDHGWCRSIYTVDPNGILVEFCTTTQAMTAADREEARRLLPHAA